jgi:hypothetical protein
MSRLRTRAIASLSIAAVAIVSVLLALAIASPAVAAPVAPHWRLESHVAPTNLPLKGTGVIVLTASNIGDAEINGKEETIRLTDMLPKGLKVIGMQHLSHGTPRFEEGAEKVLLKSFECPKESGAEIECEYGGPLAPYEQIELIIEVETELSEPATLETKARVEGGGSPSAELSPVDRLLDVNGQQTHYGVESYKLTPENEKFEPDEQAGSHPFQLTTTFDLNETLQSYPGAPHPLPSAPSLQKNLTFKLPPGLIGNANPLTPNSAAQCTQVAFGAQELRDLNACPEDTVVGVASVTFTDPVPPLLFNTFVGPVFNLVPAPGEPARFGFVVAGVPIVLDTSVRTGSDYGATVTVHYASQAVQVLDSRVTFWGVPADERHNEARGWDCLGHGSFVKNVSPIPVCGNPKVVKPAPLLTLPTVCGPIESPMEGNAWDGKELTAPGTPHEKEIFNEEPTSLSGCEGLAFNPSIEVLPDTQAASTPTGMSVKVSMPQQGLLEAEGVAGADIKSTTLALPVGLQTSAGAANGLVACKVFETGFSGLDGDSGATLEHELEQQSFTPTAASCPNEAKIGTVDIKTPVLEKDVVGSVYLGSQDTNPFASPLVLYIIAEEPKSKVLVKLAGEVEIDPATGQLISKFKKTPQTPFETLTLHLFNGPTASQATPAHCGKYPSKATFATWSSGEEVESEPAFEISSGPNGTSCPGATLPFTPSFETGSTNPEAGQFSPFTLKIDRPDGNAALRTISMQLPPGLAAVLSSVTPCQEPNASNGTCGPDSLIGVSNTSAGLGGAPYNLPGNVYLTGPYNGAPFGLSAVTKLTAGPFHLGTAVARSSISINETTAAATIVTAATKVISETGAVEEFPGLPEKIKGLPSQIKQLTVSVNRNEFQFNPTNCTPTAITGTLSGYEGTSSLVSSPFDVINCGSLPFQPKLTATVAGQGSKLDGTTFAVTVESPGLHQANIHKVDLTIPAKLPSRLTTIQKACLDSVFAVSPANCDEGSVIGEGIVHTPVFTNPLRGNAYLVSHGGAAFPDVEFVLKGEGNEAGVTIVLDGKTDIKAGVTYSRFETAPDAPFTKFESIFPAGPHSALTPSVPESENFNLCKQTLTVPTEITGQNGAFISQATPVTITGCKGVAANKVKKLTRAQKLAKALKQCRTKYKAKSKKSKRLACEKQARKKYGPIHKAKKPPAKKK